MVFEEKLLPELYHTPVEKAKLFLALHRVLFSEFIHNAALLKILGREYTDPVTHVPRSPSS